MEAPATCGCLHFYTGLRLSLRFLYAAIILLSVRFPRALRFRFLHHIAHGLVMIVAAALAICFMNGRGIVLLSFLPRMCLVIHRGIFISFTHNLFFMTGTKSLPNSRMPLCEHNYWVSFLIAGSSKHLLRSVSF